MLFFSAIYNAAQDMVERLLNRDEDAFRELLDKYHTPLMRLAMAFVSDRATAEEVVQETWVAVFKGLPKFEGRSSLKTWIFRILTFQAQKRAVREARMISMTDWSEKMDDAVDPNSFTQAGQWARPPTQWGKNPEDRLMRADVLEAIEKFVATLPPAQQAVLVMRDVEGWPSKDVCELLELTPGNQRILLHRARQKMRDMLNEYFIETEGQTEHAPMRSP